MSQGPYDTIQYCCEMFLLQWIEDLEIVFDEGLEEGEKVCSDLRKGVEVGRDEG